MNIEIRCTRNPLPRILDGVYPWINAGERTLCPQQNPALVEDSPCLMCEPGHTVPVVQTGTENGLRYIGLDPSKIPLWVFAKE